MFQRRQQEARNRDALEQQTRALSPAPPVELTAVPVKKVADGIWAVERGFTHNQALKAGLRAMDLDRPDEGIRTLPRGNRGQKVLMCSEAVYEGLLTGARRLSAVPKAELSAAQGDLRHFSWRQLLRIRATNLDWPPEGEMFQTEQAVKDKLDQLLFSGMGAQVASNAGGGAQEADVAAHQHFRLGKDLVLIAAVAESIPSSEWWVCWLGEKRIYVSKASLAVHSGFPQAGVLEIEDRSKLDHLSGGKQMHLEWRVRHLRRDADVSTARQEATAEQPSAASFGATCHGPQLTESTLKGSLHTLKKTGVDVCK